jgi:4-alpha-glucanotransferase
MRSDLEIKQTQQAVLQITGGSPETVHSDLIKAALSTDARLAIAPLQDFLGLGSEARMNIPGTSSNNWRWRVREEQLSNDVRAQVAAWISESGRALQN